MNVPRVNLDRPILPQRTGPVAAVVRRWRSLSGGTRVRDPDRRTLIACSAGADSSALALCLAAAGSNLVIAHVLHDLRTQDLATADLDLARSLAAGLSLPFVSACVSCRTQPGNLEAIARRERYAALVALAREHACPFIATAHHADDQLETLLMRLARGAGPRGLAGIAPKRRLAPGVTLIRPMLEITRADAEAICRGAGVSCATDVTNSDRTRLRAAIRHDVIPPLRAIAPSIAATAGRIASVQRGIARDLDRVAKELLLRASESAGLNMREPVCLSRHILADSSRAAVELALRHAITRIGRAPDAISKRTLDQLLAAIRADSRETKHYEFPNTIARLDATSLVIRPRS